MKILPIALAAGGAFVLVKAMQHKPSGATPENSATAGGPNAPATGTEHGQTAPRPAPGGTGVGTTPPNTRPGILVGPSPAAPRSCGPFVPKALCFANPRLAGVRGTANPREADKLLRNAISGGAQVVM